MPGPTAGSAPGRLAVLARSPLGLRFRCRFLLGPTPDRRLPGRLNYRLRVGARGLLGLCVGARGLLGLRSGPGHGERLVVCPAPAIRTGGFGLTVAALPARLTFAIRPRIGSRIEDAVIVLGVLVIGFRHDTIARGQRIAREPYVFLVNLMGVAAHPTLGPAAVEVVMSRRSAVLLSMRPPTRSPSV
jgi:hypothetical protein